MQKVKVYSRYFYEHPLVRYIFVGGTTFIIDFGLLIFLHQSLKLNLAISTSIAYWVAIAYNFYLNRRWTFSIKEKESLRQHLANYLILLCFNYLFTVIFVSVVGKHIYFGLAKALAVVIQTSWTYFIYKRYVFADERRGKQKGSLLKALLKDKRKLAALVAVVIYSSIFFSSLAYSTVDQRNLIDGGWRNGLASFRHNHNQSFGNNVFFTYGPLSTRIVTTVHPQDKLSDFIISLLIVTFIFILCAYAVYKSVAHSKPQEGWTLIVSMAVALLCLLSLAGIDILFFITLLCAIYAAMRASAPLKILAIFIGPCILATYKNSFLITILPVLILFGAFYVSGIRSKVITTISLLLLPIISLIFEGVSISNLGEYMHYAVSNSLAYGEFMNLVDNSSLTMKFTVIFLLYVLFRILQITIKGLVDKKVYIKSVAWVIAELWVIYIALKEAITRSDAHLIVFLPFLIYIALSILLVYAPRNILKLAASVGVVVVVCTLMTLQLVRLNKSLAVPHLSRHTYLTDIKPQVSLVNTFNYYNYNYFKKERRISQTSYMNVSDQSALLMANFSSYLSSQGKSLENQSIVDYGNSIIYLNAFPSAHTYYSPFMQNYPAQPPSVFDPLYKSFLIEHPRYFVLWDKLAPNIDSKMPSEDLPETSHYIQSSYRVVAQDQDHGLFILAQRSSSPTRQSCQSKVVKSALSRKIVLPDDTRRARIFIHPSLKRKLWDLVYKKPIYTIIFSDNAGRTETFRVVPATLQDNIYLSPWQPFVADNRPEDYFKINSFIIVSSDGRQAPINIVFSKCQD